jgi:RNA polymerase sigma-70 factor (ECF subfamily)
MNAGQASASDHHLTILLRRMADGDQEAAELAAAEVYSELRRLARRSIPNEPGAISLQPTVIVNEAFVRLLRGEKIEWQNRQHFYLLCGRMMRRIVVDHFRERNAQKRATGRNKIELEDVVLITEERRDEVLIVDEALNRLQEFDPRAARVVELRYFLGLSESETAELLDLSVRTIRRDWDAAQGWLKRYLKTPKRTGQ